MKFGVFIYNGVEPIDLATFGVLSMARRIRPDIEITTLAPAAGPVTLSNGLVVLAEHAITNAPRLGETSSQTVNVAGRRIRVEVKPTGAPGEYRVLAVRDTISIISDPDAERENNRAAARRIMDITCQGKNYQVNEGEIAGINYNARFTCS